MTASHMETILRNAPKAELKRIFKSALEQEITAGCAPVHPIPMPALFARPGEYRPVEEVLLEEHTALRSR
ncbi:MAG: hypothetical protein IJD13_00170 [Oscillospiraceae bacterium]|nr:hypothetical protein [Oscillospiraceae bacterium]